ncbi:MAG: apolipoprotein N-acyltransferase [Beijerinckiaceae bacterium]|jgi:apolipoprotein N-acyltransferase|nr:apolipoprotein N-acyltransferase [Beijerinckiaceae bacterium]
MVAGAIGALALAPLNILPAFAVPMVIAVWLIDGCASGAGANKTSTIGASFSAARIGWWWGFGYFLAGFWWLGAAFLVEADKFAWALPLGVVGLPAALALFPAAGFFLARVLWCGNGARIFALATGLGLAEWLRGTILTGFPWNDLGMVLGGNKVLAQLASVIGLHGLTFIAVFLAAAPATIADFRDGTRSARFIPRGRYGWTSIAFACISAMVVFGALRLGANPTAFADHVKLRLVQPNVPQDNKFRPEMGPGILAGYLKLSDQATSPQSAGVTSVTHVFWPESPFPFLLSQNADALAQIAKLLPRGTSLITGAARAEHAVQASAGRKKASLSYYNSIHLIEANGLIAQTYDKIKLVPFGEYLPMSSFLQRLGLHHFVHIPGGFSPGTVVKSLNLPGIGDVLPLICYEAIFPGVTASRSKGANRPRVIVNVTNDGWFGPTSGPHQHFAQARLRSIEEGLPMIRVANTGISAVIDPVGRVLKSLPLGIKGTIDSRLPKPGPQTIFSAYPFGAPASTALIFLLITLVFRIRRSS